MEASRQSAASSAPVKRSVAAAQACRQGGSSSGLRGDRQLGNTGPYTIEIDAEPAAMCHLLMTMALLESVSLTLCLSSSGCSHRPAAAMRGMPSVQDMQV